MIGNHRGPPRSRSAARSGPGPPSDRPGRRPGRVRRSFPVRTRPVPAGPCSDPRNREGLLLIHPAIPGSEEVGREQANGFGDVAGPAPSHPRRRDTLVWADHDVIEGHGRASIPGNRERCRALCVAIVTTSPGAAARIVLRREDRVAIEGRRVGRRQPRAADRRPELGGLVDRGLSHRVELEAGARRIEPAEPRGLAGPDQLASQLVIRDPRQDDPAPAARWPCATSGTPWRSAGPPDGSVIPGSGIEDDEPHEPNRGRSDSRSLLTTRIR